MVLLAAVLYVVAQVLSSLRWQFLARPLGYCQPFRMNEVTKEGKQSTIVPNVSGNLYDLPHGFSFFFELYNQAGADSAALTYRVFDRKEKLIYTQSEHRRLDGKKSEVIAKIDSARFPAGSYHLDITAETIRNSDSAPTYKSEKRRDFVMRWGSVPLTMDDLELAIKETKYIASSKEYNAMMDAPTLVEKQKLFREFWSKRDPSEGAQRNINMDEYYSRVQYSNDHFSHFIEGWRPDMGMVFILFGAPNTIDRHPFEIDSKPYKVGPTTILTRKLFSLMKLVSVITGSLRRFGIWCNTLISGALGIAQSAVSPTMCRRQHLGFCIVIVFFPVVLLSQPKIASIEIYGNHYFSQRELLEFLPYSRGTEFSQERLPATVHSLVNHYRDEGFFFRESIQSGGFFLRIARPLSWIFFWMRGNNL